MNTKVKLLLLVVAVTSCTINNTLTLNLKLYETQKRQAPKIQQENEIEEQRFQKENETKKLLYSIPWRNQIIMYNTCIDIRRRNIKGITYEFPCGQCGNCRTRKKLEWLTRLELEVKTAISAHFVSLDYDDEHLPLTDQGESKLEFKDLKKFFANLRNYRTREDNPITNNYKLRYFAVGEYGKKNTRRPHYHIILFNCSNELLKKLPRIWQNGSTDHSPLKDTGAIRYTLKYCFKSLEDTQRTIPPQARMSRNLGLEFLKQYPSRVQKGLIDMGGYKVPIPKSFRKKFYHDAEWEYIKEYNENMSWNNYIEELERLESVGERYPQDWIQSERHRKSAYKMRTAEKLNRNLN